MCNEFTNAYMRRWRKLQKQPAHHIGKVNDNLRKLEASLSDAEDVALVVSIRKQLSAMRKRYQ